MHVAGTNACARVGILISAWALRENVCSSVQFSARIADIGPVARNAVVVAVRAISNTEGSPGLEDRDAGKLPPTQWIPQPTRAWSWNGPQINDGKALWPVEITHTAIQLQPASHDRDGCPIHPVRLLLIDITDALAGAIDELRPGIGRRHLESVGESAIEARL